MLEKWSVSVWTAFSSDFSTLAGSCEYGKVLSDPIKGEEFLDQLMNNYLSRNTLFHSIRSLLIILCSEVSVLLIVTDKLDRSVKLVTCMWGVSNFHYCRYTDGKVPSVLSEPPADCGHSSLKQITNTYYYIITSSSLVNHPTIRQ